MILKNIMFDYLNESSNDKKFEVQNSFRPLNVKKSEWSLEERSIKKVFKFEDRKFFENFIVEIIKYKRDLEVDIETRFRDLNVGIIIHAYSNHISELELECSKEIDKIKKDVMYYYANEE